MFLATPLIDRLIRSLVVIGLLLATSPVTNAQATIVSPLPSTVSESVQRNVTPPLPIARHDEPAILKQSPPVYLPIRYKPWAVLSGAVDNEQLTKNVLTQQEAPAPEPASALPTMLSASEPANGQDVVYLVNSKQVGRTRNFSWSNPNWISATGAITGDMNSADNVVIRDFILDPQDPYHTAWAVGNGGIWRTTNLDSDPPTWVSIQSMYQITTAIPSAPPTHGVARIAGDASRPGFFVVVLGYEQGAPWHAWVGFTTDNGNNWAWRPLSFPMVMQGSFSSVSLAMSQDGSGQIWVGGGDYNGGAPTNYIAYSKDYAQSWQTIWSGEQLALGTNPSALYYTHGTLFAIIGRNRVAKSVDRGFTWTYLSNANPGINHLPYGISGTPQTDQMVYYIDTAGTLQYSVNGGMNFITRTTSWNAFPSGSLAGAVVNWLDNPNRMTWTNNGPCRDCTTGRILAYSEDGGLNWQDKTGDWFTTFAHDWEGATASSGSDGNVFILIPSQVAHLRDLAKRGKLSDCALGCTPPVNWANDPIDTSNGNLSYQVTDLSVPSLGGNLTFQRSYASASSNVTSSLGYGWTDNFEMKMTGLPNPLSSPTHPVTLALQSSNGSQLLFFHIANGQYAPDFGVTAQLSRTVSGNVVTYTLTDKGQTVYTFNISGSLLSKVDALGHLTTYSYTAPNTLTQVTDVTTDRWLKFNYDTQGRVTNVWDNANRAITFTYNVTGDLASLIDVRGLTWTYSYTGSHLLWKVVDPDSRTVVRTEYDTQGRAIEQYDGLDNRTTQLDFSLGSATIITNARNIPSTDVYARGTWAGGLDANGQPITRSYDLNFRPTTITDANGHATQMQWSPDGSNLEKTTYSPQISITQKFDALNNLTQTTDARGFTTTYTYSGTFLTGKADAYGNTWIYTPTTDGRNLLAAEAAPGGRVTQYQYDQLGQRTVMTDALKNVTRYRYNDIGQLISTTVNSGQPSYERTTLNRYDGAGNLISTTINFNSDPNADARLYNLTTLYEYDGASRQIAITDTVGRVTHNEYDPAGRLVATTANFTTTFGVDPALYNLTTSYGYDQVGNRVFVTDTRGLVTKTDYDNLNRPVTITQNYSPTATTIDYNLRTITQYDPAGNVIEQINPLNHVTRTWYDQLNRPVTVTHDFVDGVYDPARPDEDLTTITTYDAAGNAVASQDPMGRTSTFGYDPLNHLISTTNPLTGTTRYAYDGLGNRIWMTDVLTRPTHYEYDALNRLITTTLPDNSWTVNTYDSAGNRVKVTDALNYSTVYTYNLRGQLIAQVDPAGATSYEYDRLGNRIVMTDANGTVTRQDYDIAGRVLVMTASFTTTAGLNPNAYNLVTRYRYDKSGNVISTTNPLSATTVYTYDALNRLVVQTDALTRTWSFQYNALGNRTVITDANRQITQYQYNQANRVTAITYPTDTVRYQYDAVGNRTVMTDALGVSTFRYDALNRLVGHTNPLGQIITNTYDAYGNVIALRYPDGKIVTTTYDAVNRPNTVLDWNAQTTTYLYDPAGRLITSTLPNGLQTVNAYDNANRLTRVTHTRTGDGQVLGDYQFTLDGVGNRVTVSETVSTPSAGSGQQASQLLNTRLASINFSATQLGVTLGPQGVAPMRPLPTQPCPEPPCDPNPTNPPVTLTPIIEPSSTPTAVPTNTPTRTPTATSTSTATATRTPTATNTPTRTPTATATNTPTRTPTATATATATATRTPTATSTNTPTNTPTNTATATSTNTPTATPTSTSTPPPILATQLVIQYTYDPLSRLTDAAYSNGQHFQYAYDPLGDRMVQTETITSTVVTTYTYDAVSQLVTSKANNDTTVWYYRYDSDGNLVEMTPNGTAPANGALRYTYDAANRLNKAETYSGSGYALLAQMAYDGIGSRVVLTGWVSGVVYTTTYASRIAGKVEILQATSGSTTTSYLYGVGAIGEFGEQTAYYLSDGTGSVRQVVDTATNVLFARWYDPYGQILTQAGSGDALYGYLGAQVDRISGLLYINGAYYDPVTGRFLSPVGNGPNPYVPLGGAALAPILIVALLGRKKKGQLWTGWLVLAVMMSAGLMLTACGNETPTPQRPPNIPNPPTPISTPTPTAVTNPSPVSSPPTSVPLPPTPVSCPTPPTPLATLGHPAYTQEELDIAARIVSAEVGSGIYYRGTDDEFRRASTGVAWTMRNRLEIGYEHPDPNLPRTTVPHYTDTFTTSNYNVYPKDIPATPDPIALEATRAVFDAPNRDGDPTLGSIYVINRQYYLRLKSGNSNLKPEYSVEWTPQYGGDPEGVYFFYNQPK